MIKVTDKPPGGDTALSAVRGRPCPLCGTPAGQPCQPKPAGFHLARFLDAFTAGQLTRAYMRKVLAELVVLDACAVITAAPEPEPQCADCGHGINAHNDIGAACTSCECGRFRTAGALAHLTDRLGRAR